MRDYIILTDSSCDLPAPMAEELELTVVPLSVLVGEKEYTNYLDEREITAKEFYTLLREGKTATTSAVNVSQFTTAMEAFLKEDKDILYLGFSSALSATYNAAALAAEELRTKYPDAKIMTVDTLCASLGQGMLIHLAVQEKRQGKTLEEVRDYAENTKLRICHWFTVDDLNHLKRGGRLSSTTAFVGTVLNVKPILHMDAEGHLINVDKVRGRKVSIKNLLQHMSESTVLPPRQPVFICHADCEDDANYLADLVREQLGAETFIINSIGPVIGAHAGPGTLALFFLAERR